MTTEDEFQALLDTNPHDHHTRLVFADWLQERGDTRAEGYRALGALRRVPTWAFNQPSTKEPWYLWVSGASIDWLVGDEGVGGSFRKMAKAMRGATLPADWCRWIYLNAPEEVRNKWNFKSGWFGYATTRRAVEDAAALAFIKLSLKRRTVLLAAPPATESAPAPRKSRARKSNRPDAKEKPAEM
jgi:uncharacterized protein (TIGR02996 family)